LIEHWFDSGPGAGRREEQAFRQRFGPEGRWERRAALSASGVGPVFQPAGFRAFQPGKNPGEGKVAHISRPEYLPYQKVF